MGADVVHLLGLHLGTGQRGRDGRSGTFTVGRRRTHVEGVGGQRATGDGRVGYLAPTVGVGGRLDDGHDGPFGEHEAVALGVEWTACRAWLVIAFRERPHGGEPGEHHRGDGGVGAAADDNVCLVSQDQAASLQERVQPAGTRQCARRDRTVDAEIDGDLAGRHVGQ